MIDARTSSLPISINARFLAAPVTGVQRFALEVTAGIQRRRPTVLFVPADAPLPTDLEVPPRVVRGRLRGHAFEQLELPRLAARERARVVLHLAGTAPLRRRGDVLVIHDVLPLTQPAWFGRRFRMWRRLVLRTCAPRAARIVTVSRWAAAEIEQVLDVRSERIVVSPQGLAPFDQPAPADRVRATCSRLGLDRPYLLSIGAGDPRKNLSFLGEVLRRWPGGRPPTLALVGAPGRRLFSRVESWGADLDVRRLGRVDDATLHALYTGAAVLCYPSAAEGYGRPPLEALACGTAAVVADYPCAPEVLGAGAWILPLDPMAWVRVLQVLVENDSRGEAGLRPASRPLVGADGWERAVDVVLEACDAAWHEQAAE